MKTEKIKKVGGSVLFTVVAVMTLLVVFMAGTMILVSSANHRSHINYSTAQTTVTSRTVAESTLKALTLSPKNVEYENYFFSVNESNPRIEIPVSLAASDANAALGTLGDIENVVVTYEGKMNFYSNGSTDGLLEGESAEKGWKERDVIKVTSSVNLGRSKSSTSIYLVVDPPNGDPGGGGGGAGFVTTGGADFACQTSLYGGSYINLPKRSETEDDDYDVPSTYRSSYTMRMVNTGTSVEADAVFNGNLALGNANGFIFPAKGKGVTVWGDLMTCENSGSHFKCYVNSANFRDADGKVKALKFNEIPFVYVDGRLCGDTKGGYNFALYDNVDGSTAITDIPLNVFCGSIDTTGDMNAFNFRADVFCMDPDATTYIKSSVDTVLHSWSASVINKTLSNDANDYVAGNYFSKGNLKIAGDQRDFIVDGDVRIEGNLDLSELTNNKKLVVGGDLVVGGSLIGVTKDKLAVTGSIYTDGTIEGIEPSLKANIEIQHEIDPKYVRIDAAEGTWEERELKAGDFYDYEYDADGNATIVGGYGIEDIGYGNFKITNAVGEEYEVYNNTGKFYYAPLIDSKNIANPYKQYVTGGNVKDPYLVECDKNGDPTGVPTDEPCWYYDSTDLITDPPVHYTEDDVTEIKYYNTETGAYVDESAAYGGDKKELASYKYSNIYPAYAEKKVLIGKSTISDVPVTETKVVMTMQEVLDNVVDPYKNKGYPVQFQSQMTTEGALKEYSNIKQFYNDVVTGYSTKMLCKTDLSSLSLETEINETSGKLETKPLVAEYTEGPEFDPNTSPNDVNFNNDAEANNAFKNKLRNTSYVINRSCILKNFSIADNDCIDPCKNLVINPEKGDIIIVIDGTFSMPSGWNIIVDDVTTNNKVYFYLKENAKMDLGGGLLSTVKYTSLINSNMDFQAYTDASLVKKGADGKPNPHTLKELGYNTPNVYIYGDTGSSVTYSNFRYIAANIVSPDIAVTASATSGAGSGKVYYNGTNSALVDGANEYIFGCCNSKNTTFPNAVKVLFTPDTGETEETFDTEDRSHWLKVLYYDEY